MDVGDRLELATSVLDRNLAWIAAAEGKAGFAVAINTAMLAGLATAYANASAVDCLAYAMAACTALFVLFSVVCAGLVVRPRTSGPRSSLIFFGKIASMDRASYREQLATVTDVELLADLADQIHRNAEIATEKHQWSRMAINASFVAGLAWVASVALLVRG